MKRRAWISLLLLATLATGALAAAAPTSMQPLIARMTHTGRAEARVAVTAAQLGEAGTTRRGTLTLEPPDRIRLDFQTNGERLTARSDGGEWLQPDLHQMLTMDAQQAAQAAALWDVLRNGSAGFVERKLGSRTYRLVVASADAEPESVRVTLGADRLPARIETQAGDLRWTIALTGWRFSAAKGKAAFVLRAPAGFETLAMP